MRSRTGRAIMRISRRASRLCCARWKSRCVRLSRMEGEEASVVVASGMEGAGNFGYNAATGEYGDLMQAGVVDPTKVTRTALQNAASVAGLLLMTDCAVCE